MENGNKGVINIYITNTKQEDYFINEIITQKLISSFNKSIKLLFSEDIKEKPIQITNRKIYLHFMQQYLYKRNLVYLLKQKNQKISIKKYSNYLYLYVLFYLYINSEFINPKLIDIKLLSIDKFFRLIIILYKSKLFLIEHTINFFKYYLFLLTNNRTNIPMNENVNTLSNFIKYFWKISKEIEYENNKKEINELIKKEILTKLFDILNGTQNLNNYLHLIHSFRKEENIFLLIKMIVERKFLSDENKVFIETNIINFLKNNFRKEHLNYFYKILSNLLIKFNSLNSKEIKKINEECNYLGLNKNFEFLTKIMDILIKVIKEEENQLKDISNYYCDKGFVFNLDDKDTIGCRINNVFYSKNKKSSLCILFSFLLINNKIKNENQVIFSIGDQDKEYLCLFSKGKELYLRYYSNKFYEIKILDKINYNKNNLFFFFYDKDKIRISINNKNNKEKKEGNFKLPNKFNVFIGSPEKNKSINKPQFTFNGIIYPIIIFELIKKVDLFTEIIKYIQEIKNSYYLIAEKYFEDKKKMNISKDILIDNYKEYYGLMNNLENENKIQSIINYINQIILYINPFIVTSTFNKKLKKYKDITFYEINDGKNKVQYSYEFNVAPNIDNGIIFSFKDYNIISYFKINNGLNLITLQIETLYNYIILINNNENYMKIVNNNKNKFYKMMQVYII